MKDVVIIGPGGIGGTFGALLARAGECRVTLIGRPGAHVEAIRKRGFRLEGADSFTTPIDILDDPAELTACDVLVLAVKAQDSQAALTATAHVEVRDFVASIQNGVVKDDQLAQTFGSDLVVGALAIVAAERTDPGTVRWTYDGGTHFGELDGSVSDRVEWIVQRCSRAGLRANASRRISSATWTKLVGWSPIGLLATLSRQSNRVILSDELLATVYVAMVRELGELATARDIPLLDLGPFHVREWLGASADDAVAKVMASPLARSESTHSALQDIQRGQRTELEALLQPLLADATSRGLPVVRVQTLYAALMALERSL